MPGQVTGVKAAVSGGNSENIALSWKKPATGGKPWDYIIERKVAGEWQQIYSSCTAKATLKGQPAMTQLEYRIIARNTSGAGMASAAVMMILPAQGADRGSILKEIAVVTLAS
jgi:hypothetical protein